MQQKNIYVALLKLAVSDSGDATRVIRGHEVLVGFSVRFPQGAGYGVGILPYVLRPDGQKTYLLALGGWTVTVSGATTALSELYGNDEEISIPLFFPLIPGDTLGVYAANGDANNVHHVLARFISSVGGGF